MKFTVRYEKNCPSVDITSKENEHSHPEAFMYSSMYKLYTTGHGHGLQSNDCKNYKSLMKMCDKISQAVYDYQKEIN